MILTATLRCGSERGLISRSRGQETDGRKGSDPLAGTRAGAVEARPDATRSIAALRDICTLNGQKWLAQETDLRRCGRWLTPEASDDGVEDEVGRRRTEAQADRNYRIQGAREGSGQRARRRHRDESHRRTNVVAVLVEQQRWHKGPQVLRDDSHLFWRRSAVDDLSTRGLKSARRSGRARGKSAPSGPPTCRSCGRRSWQDEARFARAARAGPEASSSHRASG
jgi:hypothetical protein